MASSWWQSEERKTSEKIKKAGEEIFSGFLMKDWRRPTLAEPIGLLPSAQQCLTAVFGMGTGRTTAVLPPKYYARPPRAAARRDVRKPDPRKNLNFKEHLRIGSSLKSAHRKIIR